MIFAGAVFPPANGKAAGGHGPAYFAAPSNDLPAAEIFGQGRGRRIIIVTAKCLKFSLDGPIILLERIEAFLNLAQQGF